jgi:hypothetical protein
VLPVNIHKIILINLFYISLVIGNYVTFFSALYEAKNNFLLDNSRYLNPTVSLRPGISWTGPSVTLHESRYSSSLKRIVQDAWTSWHSVVITLLEASMISSPYLTYLLNNVVEIQCKCLPVIQMRNMSFQKIGKSKSCLLWGVNFDNIL